MSIWLNYKRHTQGPSTSILVSSCFANTATSFPLRACASRVRRRAHVARWHVSHLQACTRHPCQRERRLLVARVEADNRDRATAFGWALESHRCRRVSAVRSRPMAPVLVWRVARMSSPNASINSFATRIAVITYLLRIGWP